MPKIYYFSNKFQKLPSAGGCPPLNLQYWWSEVTW